MKTDLSRECKSQNMKEIFLYTLSINMHVLYGISKTSGNLLLISAEDPMCASTLTSDGAYFSAKALHVTNFAAGTDLVLVGLER